MKRLIFVISLLLLSGCVNLTVNLGGTVNNVTVMKRNNGGDMGSTNDIEEKNPSTTTLKIPLQ